MRSRGTRRNTPAAQREPPYAPPPEDATERVSLSRLIGAAGRPLPGDRQRRFFGDREQMASLWCAGDLSLVQRPSVAIVGTRDPTSGGAARARRLARELGQAGVVVVSGLARGIDTDALIAALECGGRVVAVIGTPLDRAYPAENQRLQERIYREHLLVSQFEPGHRLHHTNFPVRNRLMAALSDATAIIEAGEQSGTLHQATECVRLGRWLFIARSIVDDDNLTWPARFLGKPRVRILSSTSEILDAIGESDR